MHGQRSGQRVSRDERRIRTELRIILPGTVFLETTRTKHQAQTGQGMVLVTRSSHQAPTMIRMGRSVVPTSEHLVPVAGRNRAIEAISSNTRAVAEVSSVGKIDKAKRTPLTAVTNQAAPCETEIRNGCTDHHLAHQHNLKVCIRLQAA